jgi:hypothetical protein
MLLEADAHLTGASGRGHLAAIAFGEANIGLPGNGGSKMNIRVALAAAVVALVGIPVAFAASTKPTPSTMQPQVMKTAYHSMSPAQSCTALETQLSRVIGTEAKHPQITLARQLQSDGTKLCRSKETKPGAEKLRQALYALGVRPSV